ncbi:MAG: class I SAM-dependent methyltransferase [Cyanobacteria bacterium P01_F01_bin.143]
MQSIPKIDSLIPSPENITKFAYETIQQGKGIFGLSHKRIASFLGDVIVTKKPEIKSLSPETQRQLIEKRSQLLEKDWQDAQEGVYPVDILFDNPWLDFFRYYPQIWLDLPQVWQKQQNKEFQSFANQIDLEGYPSYYVRNFHYQTDGYLSDMSANLYDLQVEILFNGTADPMRRRILAPLKAKFTQNSSQKQIKLLDVACGTGRTLKFIRGTLPKASLYGLDLSPANLRKANQILSEMPGELPQLVQANGENLPYLDNYFDGITSVFLFHELPPKARQRVINECFRVTKPGGICIICDALQKGDCAEFQPMLDNFPITFHEPYFKHYSTDNLDERLEKAGFENIRIETHFASKYWFAHKPKVD